MEYKPSSIENKWQKEWEKDQSFKAKNLATKKSPLAGYQKKNIKKKLTHYEMLKKLELSKKDFFKLKVYSRQKKIDFLSKFKEV